jgi:hypothetical protein
MSNDNSPDKSLINLLPLIEPKLTELTCKQIGQTDWALSSLGVYAIMHVLRGVTLQNIHP